MRTRSRFASVIQLTPATLYYLALFGAPLALLVAYSFYTTQNYQYTPGFSLHNYADVFTGGRFRKFYVRTIRIAGITTIIVTLVAYVFSFIVTFLLRTRRELLYFLVLVSMFGGYLVRIYAWRNLFGSAGIINSGLMDIGLISAPLSFLNNTEFTVIVALVNFYIPFAVLPIYSAMQNVSPGLIEAGQDLGQARWLTAIPIVLPLAMRGFAASFVLVFVSTAGEWVTPAMLGGTDDQMIGNEIQYQFGAGYNWPMGSALSVTLVFSLVLIVITLGMLVRRWLR